MTTIFGSHWLIRCLLLGLFAPLLLWTEDSFIKTSKRAEKLFYEKLYGDALPLYSQLFTLSSDKELKTQWALRLATCHLEEKHPQAALALLSSLETSTYRNPCLFFMSQAYRQMGNSSQALKILQECSLPNSQHAQDLIALEKGYHFMQIGDFTSAQSAFASILWQAKDSLLYDLAQLQLAKMAFFNHQYHEVLQILALLSHDPLSHPLNVERIYLKGCAFLAQQREAQAAHCFEELLPKALTEKTNGPTPILYGLFISYLKLAMASTETQQLESWFSKIEPLI